MLIVQICDVVLFVLDCFGWGGFVFCKKVNPSFIVQHGIPCQLLIPLVLLDLLLDLKY